MFYLVLPFPPDWEAQTQQIAAALFAESGDFTALQAPFWLTVAELPKKPSAAPPLKAFFRLHEIVNRRGRLIFRFETECALPPNARCNRVAFQTAELDLGPFPLRQNTALIDRLNRLSRRKTKTAPCYLETLSHQPGKESQNRFFR